MRLKIDDSYAQPLALATTKHRLAAVLLTPGTSGEFDATGLVQIERGANLSLYGPGWNNVTVTVRWGDLHCVVFREDICPTSAPTVPTQFFLQTPANDPRFLRCRR